MRVSIPKTTFRCLFKAQVVRKDGSIKYEGPWFKNTILNSGLDMLGGEGSTIPGCISTCAVGEGASPPEPSDTGLSELIASTSSVYGGRSESVGTEDEIPYREYSAVYEFGVGSFGNNNIREVGLGSSSTALMNRQLFRDESGDPVTIEILEDEGLRVHTKFRVYAFAPFTTSMMLNGAEQDVSVEVHPSSHGHFYRTHDSTMYISRAGRVSLIEINGGTDASSYSYIGSYIPGSFYRDFEFIWNAGRFVGDIEYIDIHMHRATSFHYEFCRLTLTTPITVTDTQEIKMQVRRSWGAHNP